MSYNPLQLDPEQPPPFMNERGGSDPLETKRHHERERRRYTILLLLLLLLLAGIIAISATVYPRIHDNDDDIKELQQNQVCILSANDPLDECNTLDGGGGDSMPPSSRRQILPSLLRWLFQDPSEPDFVYRIREVSRGAGVSLTFFPDSHIEVGANIESLTDGIIISENATSGAITLDLNISAPAPPPYSVAAFDLSGQWEPANPSAWFDVYQASGLTWNPTGVYNSDPALAPVVTLAPATWYEIDLPAGVWRVTVRGGTVGFRFQGPPPADPSYAYYETRLVNEVNTVLDYARVVMSANNNDRVGSTHLDTYAVPALIANVESDGTRSVRMQARFNNPNGGLVNMIPEVRYVRMTFEYIGL